MAEVSRRQHDLISLGHREDYLIDLILHLQGGSKFLLPEGTTRFRRLGGDVGLGVMSSWNDLSVSLCGPASPG